MKWRAVLILVYIYIVMVQWKRFFSLLRMVERKVMRGVGHIERRRAVLVVRGRIELCVRERE